jgi:hypothetical protein
LKYKFKNDKPTPKKKNVMCNPWERTFTLALVAPLTMFSPLTPYGYMGFG